MDNTLNLFYSREAHIENAYIITVKGNESSEKYSARCRQSCDQVGMKYKVWDAFDGTKGPITTPDQCMNDSFMRLLKVTDHYLTRGEVACALSHISLWVHCAKIDKPIVILEHDSIMVQRIEALNTFNSIVYLGGSEWAEQRWPMYHVPPFASEGPNYLFICRAHAYAIDPVVAKNLLAHVLKMGIHAPLDIIMKADLFNISHQGLFAYDKNVDLVNDTTIKSRPKAGRTTDRNDNLST
jgi:GR25 family glycosyltransferase involved in LPS biosynthesis